MKQKIIFFIFIIALFSGKIVLAQSNAKLTFTITPPLIKNNLNPGETWASTVKIVNNNSSPLIIFTDALDFKSKTDGGIEFLEKDDSGSATSSQYLSRWIDVKQGPIEIAPFSSFEIPFVIKVPQLADPGGHYAAILAGTRPLEGTSGSGLTVSSMLSSLIMINVQGDIIEKGSIREFTTDKAWYDNEVVKFKVKFENKGNVHLLPRGEIRVEDMFGKERKLIEINHQSEFGNVLPGSYRAWEYEYKPDFGPLDMGRYKAFLTMAYGENGSSADANGVYFWVINKKLVGIVGGSLLGIILIIYILVKLSIRSAIKRAQKQTDMFRNHSLQNSRIKSNASQQTVNSGTNTFNTAQRQQGSKNEVVDLKKLLKK